ncbi:MAG: hypothetical protein OEY28_12335, partial [Nitrospira sp.]|nr:hypothetical protein [Nitrospira sp.]
MDMNLVDLATAANAEPPEVAYNKELWVGLLSAVRGLPAEEQTAVSLCILGGLSHSEASRVTGT